MLIFQFLFFAEYFARMGKLEDAKLYLIEGHDCAQYSESPSYAVFCTSRQTDGHVCFSVHIQTVKLRAVRSSEVSMQLC